jgi:hypothetical protein
MMGVLMHGWTSCDAQLQLHAWHVYTTTTTTISSSSSGSLAIETNRYHPDTPFEFGTTLTPLLDPVLPAWGGGRRWCRRERAQQQQQQQQQPLASYRSSSMINKVSGGNTPRKQWMTNIGVVVVMVFRPHNW